MEQVLTDFLTWQILATMSGAVVAVTLLTEFIKWVTGKTVITGTKAKICSYVSAIVVLVLANFFTQTLTLEVLTIIPFNAIIVTLSANGLYRTVQGAFSKKEAE
jgi:hypothetical protein